MALLFIDSFDHYATTDITEKWTTQSVLTGSTATIAPAGGRHSSGSFRHVFVGGGVGAVCNISKTLTPADATCIVGMAIRMPSGWVAPSGHSFLAIRDGASTQVYLRVNQDASISVVRGGVVIGTFSIPLQFDIFTHLEFRVTISNTVGAISGRINGAPALNIVGGTAADTQNTSLTQWTGIALGVLDAPNNINAAKNTDFDDLYVLDGSGPAPWNAFLGDVRVDASYPTGPGTTTQWSPSAAPNWSCVNETPPNDDSSFVETMTAGAIDTFHVPDAPAGAIIYGVQHCIAMKKTDAGSGSAAPIIRHSNLHYQGPTISPTTVYGYGINIIPTIPGTPDPWTEAAFNSAEFGYKRI
jgi:hypothetical protein